MKIQVKKSKAEVLLFPAGDDALSKKMCFSWFDKDYWQQKEAIVGQSKGRHITWFIKPPETVDENIWVLRHYYRGGLVAKLTQDLFIYTGIKRTRGFREVALLQSMLDMELPVPKAIGARVMRKGLFYKADLLMEKIAANDLVAKLNKVSLPDELWVSIGKTIANFHQKGIYHADLNAHNILLDETGKVWLIDFDRCEKRSIKTAWQQQNIDRLKRSFVKEKQLNTTFYFTEKNWYCLMDGYLAANQR